MADTRDVTCDLDAIRQTNPSYLPQSRIWLFGCSGVNPSAYASALRARLKCGGFRFGYLLGSSFSNELIDGRHTVLPIQYGAARRRAQNSTILSPAPTAVNTIFFSGSGLIRLELSVIFPSSSRASASAKYF